MPADASPPPADWYLDPDDPSQGRYWDGATWTDHRTALPDDGTLPQFGVGRPPATSVLPARASRRRRLLVVSVVALALAGGAAAWVTRDPDAAVRVAGTDLLRIRGSLELDQPQLLGPPVGEPCAGVGAFEEVDVGTRILVTDLDGREVGSAALPAGRIAPANRNLGTADALTSVLTVCRFEFTVDVPDLDAYRVGVAGFGDQRYDRDDLDAVGWHVDLGLGP